MGRTKRAPSLPTALVATALCILPCEAAFAHHDGATLPVSLNDPGNVGGVWNAGSATQTQVGLSSRAFRVSDNALYGPALGGDATVLFNGLSGVVGLGSRMAAQALVPLLTDIPDGERSGHTGLGDVRLGLRAFLPEVNGNRLWSAAADSSLPTGNAARGFGASVVVSRVSTRLAQSFAAPGLRVFAEGGVAWAWSSPRGTIADMAVATHWQATRWAGLFFEARVLGALERSKQNPLGFSGKTREVGDTSVVLTPALTVALGDNAAASVGPQLPLGFKDFDLGVAASFTYRMPTK